MKVNTTIRCITFLIFAILATISCESLAQEKTANLIPEITILRGDFLQIRYLKGFKNPLKSEGRFLVSVSKGVIWQTIKPFPSRILIRTSGDIVNLDRTIHTTTNQKKPNVAISKIMLAMLSGDQTEIEKYFIIQRREQNGLWTLTLQPKGNMARVFLRIEMKGERYIHQVIMEEKSGDKTELNFSAVSEVPNTLSAEELMSFK
ncbi:MAG: outer membrane lipoprotein carrier protein LolA [Arenimonas sp.]|nr:outer membrane lipoprotein carrier protein LolA [Arenimonas sp.]